MVIRSCLDFQLQMYQCIKDAYLASCVLRVTVICEHTSHYICVNSSFYA